MIHNIPQPDFEQFVAQNMRIDPNVEVRKGVFFVSCEQVSPIKPLNILRLVYSDSRRMLAESPPLFKRETVAVSTLLDQNISLLVMVQRVKCDNS
jgi:hypothetical protein